MGGNRVSFHYSRLPLKKTHTKPVVVLASMLCHFVMPNNEGLDANRKTKKIT